MKKLKYISVTLIVLILLTLAGIFIYSLINQQAFWYCSTYKPRGSVGTKWETMVNPAKPSIPLDVNFLNNFTIGSEPASFTVKHPSRQPPDNPFAVEVAKLTPDGTLDIGSGTLKYAGSGIAYYDANQSIDMDADFQFYDEKFQKVSDARIKELGIWNITESKSSFTYNPFPAVQFIFQHEGIEDAMFYSIEVFDGRTHSQIGTGGGTYGDPKSWRFNTHVTLWHRSPVDVVIEVSYGPSKTFEFAPKDGEGFKGENFECRLLHIFEGVDAHTSSSESTGVTVTNRIHKDTTGEPATCFFFVCRPQANIMPVTFEFLDKDGNQLRTQGSSTSSVVQRINIKEPAGKVALIRARYRTKRQRIILHLPYIPGLPEQNDDIKNLLDVYIPYASFDSSYRVGWFLSKTLQLSYAPVSGNTPQNSFYNFTYPIDFSDVRLRDIAKFYSTGGTLYIDEKNDLLKLQYPVPLRQRIGQFIQKILQRQPPPQ
jgi:hypothetical protein